jgi:NAD(P) transhydrogenase
VVLYQSTASFVDPHTIQVVYAGSVSETDDVLLRALHILVAVGSFPVQPLGFPFKHPRVLDLDEILQLEWLPRSLTVVGAGVIGSEYTCTFAALGTAV